MLCGLVVVDSNLCWQLESQALLEASDLVKASESNSIFLKLVYPVVDPLVQYEEVPQPKDDRNPSTKPT
jgi:hypothetical protein